MNPNDLDNREYIGDGLYVGTMDGDIWIYSSDGIAVLNAVALEPSVLRNFKAWLKEISNND